MTRSLRIFVAVLLFSAPATGEDARFLFRLVGAAATDRWETGSLDPSLLGADHPTGFLLELPNGVFRARGRRNGTRWSGELLAGGERVGTLVLTILPTGLLGTAYLRGSSWRLRSAAGVRHLELSRIETEAAGRCGVEERSQPPAGDRLRVPEGFRSSPAVVDVMVVHTIGARVGAGGLAEIQMLIQHAVDVTNAVFEASGVQTRVRLVGTGEIDPTAYGPLADLEEALVALQADAQVATWRDDVGADFVAAIFENGAGMCGFAHAMDTVDPSFAPDAYSISVRECAVDLLTFPHELGHNLGCRHDPESSDATPETASFPWSFGHVSTEGGFRTVMATDGPCRSCSREPVFSNPGLAIGGFPAGIAGERDNHRTIDATAPVAAGFRRAPKVFEDGFETGDTTAWTTAGR